MIVKSIKESRKIVDYLGGEFSFVATLLRGGTGSVRIVYTGGVSEFDNIASLDSSLAFCNLQFCKEGFVIRLIKKGIGQIIGIKFSELQRLFFLTTPIRIQMRGRIVIRYKADVVIDCGKERIFFQVQQVNYKSFKNYVSRNFRKEIIEWQVNPTEEDQSGNVLDLISKALS